MVKHVIFAKRDSPAANVKNANQITSVIRHAKVCIKIGFRKVNLIFHSSECNCNPDGSTALQCDANGDCACKDGFDGKTCDACKERFTGNV